MPYRSRETVERWVAEFHERGGPLPASFRILAHDTDAGESTGLVSLEVEGARTLTSISPADDGSGRWVVTFESREQVVELSTEEVQQLAASVATVAALCAYLQERSLEIVGARPPRADRPAL